MFSSKAAKFSVFLMRKRSVDVVNRAFGQSIGWGLALKNKWNLRSLTKPLPPRRPIRRRRGAGGGRAQSLTRQPSPTQASSGRQEEGFTRGSRLGRGSVGREGGGESHGRREEATQRREPDSLEVPHSQERLQRLLFRAGQGRGEAGRPA